MLKDAFLSYLLSRFKLIVSEDFGPTAATNGLVIYFNPNFLNTLTVEETLFILLHELLHITLSHVRRGKDLNPYIVNIAADIIVNDLLVEMDFKYGSLKPIRGNHFDVWGVYETLESVYEKIKDKIKLPQVSNHNYWDAKAAKSAELIVREGLAKGFGEGNGLLKRTIIKLFSANTSWQSILASLLKEGEKDYSFTRVKELSNDFLLPTYVPEEDSLRNVWFVIDVSGSMRSSDVAKTYGEILNVVRSFSTVEIFISFFSTIVTPVQTLKNVDSVKEAFTKIESTGGTSFDVIFDYLVNFRELPEAIIILTDGECTFPPIVKARNIPIFWALTEKDVMPPYGTVIYI